jgi:hypothetical protein
VTFAAHPAGTAAPTLVLAAHPVVDATGTLDLTNNDLIIKGGGAAATSIVQSLIKRGFHGGDWLGTGLTSSTAAEDPTGATAIGFAGNAELHRTAFAGVTGLTDNDVLVRYTYTGDSDLNGTTTLDDFTLFLSGYQSSRGSWFSGDLDYSGLTTLDDFTLFLSGYQRQGPPLP